MDSAKDQRGKRLRAGVYLLVAGVFARVAGDATGALAAPSAEEPGAVITALAPLLADAEFIRAFYARRGMRPVWTRENQIRALVELIEGAFDEGLDPRDYHHDRVRELLAGEERPRSWTYWQPTPSCV
jgi:murein L,D-transpeptidase YcbB/YkuD